MSNNILNKNSILNKKEDIEFIYNNYSEYVLRVIKELGIIIFLTPQEMLAL
jgi:hypothetical protein